MPAERDFIHLLTLQLYSVFTSQFTNVKMKNMNDYRYIVGISASGQEQSQGRDVNG
jgi:hypothetical protein